MALAINNHINQVSKSFTVQLNPVAESSGGGGSMVTDNGKDRAQIFTTFAKNPSNHHFSSCFCTFRHLVHNFSRRI